MYLTGTQSLLHTEQMTNTIKIQLVHLVYNIAKLPIGSPCTIAGTVHTPGLLLPIEFTATTDTAVTAQEHTLTVVLVLVTFRTITPPVDVDMVTV